jgi:hypothetical protein
VEVLYLESLTPTYVRLVVVAAVVLFWDVTPYCSAKVRSDVSEELVAITAIRPLLSACFMLVS